MCRKPPRNQAHFACLAANCTMRLPLYLGFRELYNDGIHTLNISIMGKNFFFQVKLISYFEMEYIQPSTTGNMETGWPVAIDIEGLYHSPTLGLSNYISNLCKTNSFSLILMTYLNLCATRNIALPERGLGTLLMCRKGQQLISHKQSKNKQKGIKNKKFCRKYYLFQLLNEQYTPHTTYLTI